MYIQTLFDNTYRFTKDCIDANYTVVKGDLSKKVSELVSDDAMFCTKNTCWNTTRYYFCLCGHDQWENHKTGCDHISDNITHKHHYLPEDYAAFNDSFSNILMATVRLMVHLSTENYPDFTCELSFDHYGTLVRSLLVLLHNHSIIIAPSFDHYIIALPQDAL